MHTFNWSCVCVCVFAVLCTRIHGNLSFLCGNGELTLTIIPPTGFTSTNIHKIFRLHWHSSTQRHRHTNALHVKVCICFNVLYESNVSPEQKPFTVFRIIIDSIWLFNIRYDRFVYSFLATTAKIIKNLLYTHTHMYSFCAKLELLLNSLSEKLAAISNRFWIVNKVRERENERIFSFVRLHHLFEFAWHTIKLVWTAKSCKINRKFDKKIWIS